MKDLTFKKIKWNTDTPEGILVSCTQVFGRTSINFRIMITVSGLSLVDFTDDRKCYDILSVEEGKKKAQELFEQYCSEIIRNISEEGDYNERS